MPLNSGACDYDAATYTVTVDVLKHFNNTNSNTQRIHVTSWLKMFESAMRSTSSSPGDSSSEEASLSLRIRIVYSPIDLSGSSRFWRNDFYNYMYMYFYVATDSFIQHPKGFISHYTIIKYKLAIHVLLNFFYTIVVVVFFTFTRR